MNLYVSEIQINGSLKSVFQVSFLATANLEALLVDAIHQAGDCECGHGVRYIFHSYLRLISVR